MQVFRSFIAGSLVLLSVGLLGAQPPSAPDVVARVGGAYTITFTDLTQYLRDRLFLVRYPDTTVAFEKALEAMVVDQLKRIDFFEAGLHHDDELLQSIQRTVTEELVLEYFQTQYQDRYINDEAVRDEYEKMGRQVVYRQIIVPKPEDADSATIDSIQAIVTELRNRIDAGEDFATLATQFSAGAASERTGYGTPVGWQQSLMNVRNNVIFNIGEGEVRTIETRDSYDIIRVERYEHVPVAPLDEVRDELMAALQARFMPVAIREFEREKREAIDTSSVVWNEEGLAQVVAWSNTPNFYEQGYRDTLARAIEEGGNGVIMTHADGVVDVEEFLRLLDEVLIMDRSGSHDAEGLKTFLMEAVRTEAIANRARAHGLEDVLLSPGTPSTVLRRRLVRLYDQRVIEEQIPAASEEALRAFHAAHQDSLFYQLAVVNVYALIRSDRAEAEALWAEVERGVPFEELSDRWAVKSYVRTRDGEIESYKSREAPYLGEAAFELEEGEVRGPVAFEHPEEGTQYAIIKAMARREERPLRYEEVADTIEETFSSYHRERIEAAVEERLRATYPVTVYQDVLERKVVQL